MSNIHPTALVDPSAELASDVCVGPYSVIGPDVVIGAGSQIGPHVVLQGPTRMGRDNQVFQFASIGAVPQDKKFSGERTFLEIGDRNVFRECVTVNRGTATGASVTRIGSDNLFMANAHVAHDCIIGSHCVFANCATLAGHVEVDDHVILGGYAGVHQFCKIGAHAFLANNAAATRDVPPYVMAAGAPAEPKGVNSEGLKRRGFSAEQIANIKAAYKTLYRSGLKLAEATVELERRAAEQPEVALLVAFLPRVTRSLIR
ncbi:MAG: acyl-ACP--UDP-N-acetylglucosamine O-acyltransferase [Pseudomonadota bacterium]